MKIIFEDDFILICIKPCGLLSQADSSGGESMISLLEAHTKGTVYPLHRLDKEVGGVMVYAKNKMAAAKLSRDIAEQHFKKEYIALIHGKPLEKRGEMQDLLFKDSRNNKSFVVKRERKGVKKASLEYETLKTDIYESSELSAVRVSLHTGRTHQIRVQFASRKMPLAGDKRYGANDGFSGIGLWSYRISFKHPESGENLSFSHVPENFIKDYI